LGLFLGLESLGFDLGLVHLVLILWIEMSSLEFSLDSCGLQKSFGDLNSGFSRLLESPGFFLENFTT